MPKLDATHLPDRIYARLADLKMGKEVSIRDIKALLSDEQIAAMEAKWQEQQDLRKKKRARTKEEEKELGWKSKRDIFIETYEKALKNSDINLLTEYKKKLADAEVKNAKIYLDAFFAEKSKGKDHCQADASGNNSLKRAGFSDSTSLKLKEKLKEDLLNEKQLEEVIKTKMTPSELDQIELLQEHLRNIKIKNRTANDRK
jgi:hypothetical protein